jgi:hypothetical protein
MYKNNFSDVLLGVRGDRVLIIAGIAGILNKILKGIHFLKIYSMLVSWTWFDCYL